MGMIPQVTCRHCRKKYSKLKRHCPYCGLERVKQSTRTPVSTASTVKETSASQRVQSAAKYRMIFCAVILVAVVGCTIAMVSVSISRSNAAGKQEASQTAGAADGQATTALSKDKNQKDASKDTSSDQTADENGNADAGNDAANANATTSVSITYLSAEKTEFSMNVGDAIQLDATIYPLNEEKTVEWSSSDSSILTVADGLVTGVSSGEANVIATCDGVQAVCKVLVW